MSDDKRATLAALCSRGPWGSADGDVDGVGVRRTYETVDRGPDHRGWILFPWQGSDRRTDKSLQLLRKAGLIEYSGRPKRWRVTS